MTCTEYKDSPVNTAAAANSGQWDDSEQHFWTYQFASKKPLKSSILIWRSSQHDRIHRIFSETLGTAMVSNTSVSVTVMRSEYQLHHFSYAYIAQQNPRR